MRAAVHCAAVLSAGFLAAGCGFDGPQSLPMPGAVSGDDTYPVTVVLPDAANLVPKETCRANDTVIGSVESVTLDDDLQARVVCRIRDSVVLPANVVATLSETSLLGERYLGLDPPAGQPAEGELEPGSQIRASNTRVDPDVELVLGALSQVLNGGSLGEMHVIARELRTALRHTDLRAGMRRVTTSMTTLAEGRDSILRALEGVDRLAGRLVRQRAVIARALEAVPDGLAALERQRPRIMRTLRGLEDLEAAAVPLIDSIRDDLSADLRHLSPVLRGLARQGDELALALERLATFPFPTNTMATLRGDYAGAYANAPLDIDWLNQLLGSPSTTEDPGPPGDRPPGPVTQDPGGPDAVIPPGGLGLLDQLGLTGIGGLRGHLAGGEEGPS